MRTFFAFFSEAPDDDGITSEGNLVPKLVFAESLYECLEQLNERKFKAGETSAGDFDVWMEAEYETMDEAELSEHIDSSNGDGDRWWSVSELAGGFDLIVWIGDEEGD